MVFRAALHFMLFSYLMPVTAWHYLIHIFSTLLAEKGTPFHQRFSLEIF